MNELIRKVDLEKLFAAECIGECGCCSYYEEDENQSPKCKLITDAPTVDAVEVIRCINCEMFGRSPYNHPRMGWCRLYGSHRNPDFYCRFAEPKKTKKGSAANE